MMTEDFKKETKIHPENVDSVRRRCLTAVTQQGALGAGFTGHSM